MRAVTFAMLRGLACCVASALCCAMALAGCYLSHESARDAGPVDARPPPDAPPADAREEDARVPLPSCRGPVSDWTPTEAVIDGPWGRGIARLRDGERTWIAVQSAPDGLVHLLDFDYEGPVPVVARDVALRAAGVPLAGAMDGARVAVAYVPSTPEVPMRVSISDPDGRPLAETLLMSPAAGATMALRGTRVGLAPAPVEGSAFVSLIDASDGRVVGGGEFAEAVEVSVGLGRGLFNAVVTLETGDSRLVGVDDLGTIDAGSIGVRLLAMTWDGTAVAGVDADGVIVVRVTAARVERFTPMRTPRGISLAMRGRDPWIGAIGLDADVVFASEDGFLERDVTGVDVVVAIAAHASERHVGAFVLGDGTELRWVGWTCDPER